MRAGLIVLFVIVAAAVVAALNALFIINPMQQALVLQFGAVRDTIREPGLNVKIPFVQDVLLLDKRNLDLNVPAQEIIAADQKRLVVDAFMRYRIRNPVEFYQTVNNVQEGAQRLNTFVQASLRAVLAEATFQDIVRDNRPDLMQRISADVSSRAEAIGVEVVDVKIRRADLPEANSEAIYKRMQTERQQEAREIRAQGEEAARRITAAADRTATVLRAEADRESEQIRGEGDGRKNAIFARAFSLDPQFFAFYRAMQAYENGLGSQDTRLVLSPDSDFFRYFNDPSGAQPTGSQQTGGTLPSLRSTVDGPSQAEGAQPRQGAGAPATTGSGGQASDAAASQPTAQPTPTVSDEEAAAVRREIDAIAAGAAEIEPAVGSPSLSADDSDLDAAVQQERNETSADVAPAEVSTEAAVQAASPAPSAAASAAAAGTAGDVSTTAPAAGSGGDASAVAPIDVTPAGEGAAAPGQPSGGEPVPDENADTGAGSPADAAAQGDANVTIIGPDGETTSQ